MEHTVYSEVTPTSETQQIPIPDNSGHEGYDDQEVDLLLQLMCNRGQAFYEADFETLLDGATPEKRHEDFMKFIGQVATDSDLVDAFCLDKDPDGVPLYWLAAKVSDEPSVSEVAVIPTMAEKEPEPVEPKPVGRTRNHLSRTEPVLPLVPTADEVVFKGPPIRHPRDARARHFTGLSVRFVYRTDGRGALRTDEEVLPFTDEDLTVMTLLRNYKQGVFFGSLYRDYCRATGTNVDPRAFWGQLDRLRLTFASRGIADWRDGHAIDTRDNRRKRKIGLFSDKELQDSREAS